MTMPYFQTALDSSDYTLLRGTAGNNRWMGRQYITLCKNTVVFAARVNGAISSSSFAQIAFDTVTVGAYTNIEIGETFFLSHTSDIRDYYYRGRVRAAATSTLLKVNETSVNITDDDYIFVVYDFDAWDVLSRMVGSTQYWDWDIAFHPLAPVVIGLRTAYVNWNPDGSTYRVAFDVSDSYSTDEHSSNVLTYQFTFVGGTYTVVSGALNTAVVTVDFNANTEQWGKLVITDSQGTTWTRRFYIRAHGSTDTPALDFTGAQITGSLDNGWNATVSAWNGVADVLDQTFCVIWSQEYYNGASGNVSIANNIDMVGRFHREENDGRGDLRYGYVATVKFEIEGIATQLQRLEMQDLTTINKSTAAAVDEVSFNTPQRSIVYYWQTHCTVLSLCDLSFPDGFDLTYLNTYFPNQGGNCLDAITGIAKQINASVEFAPDGRIQIVRDTRFLTDKSGVPVVANWTNSDFTTFGLPVDPVNKTGRLDGTGQGNIGGSIQAFRSRAPGSAQSYAAGQGTLDAQVLPAGITAAQAQAILNFRSGQQTAIDNLTYTQDWKATTGGYHFLIPSRGQRVTHTLSTATNKRGRSFSTSDYWQIVSVTITHDNEKASRDVTTHEELEPPTGDSGDTVPQIAGGTQTNPILLQPLDPFGSLPDDPGNYLSDDPTPNPYPPLIPPKNGNTTIETDGSIIDTSRSVIAQASPTWTGATPSNLGSNTVEDVTFDLSSSSAPIGAYDVDDDGTNSQFRYTGDAFAKPTVWEDGAQFSGVFTHVRSANTPGHALAYGPAPGSGSGTINLSYSFGTGPASANVGDTITLTSATASPGADFETQQLGVTFDQCVKITVLSVSNFFEWHCKVGGSCSPNNAWFYTDCDGNAINGPLYPTASTPIDIPHSVCMESVGASGGSTNTGGDGTHYTVTVKIEALCDPGGNAEVIHTGDYGATVTSPITVGTSPGVDGVFDLLRIGGASIAAAKNQVKLATTLGGSYSNAPGGTLAAGNPVALVLPFRRLPHGARQDNVTNPDYLLGASADNSGASLWEVDGASGTRTDITPVSGCTIVKGCLTCWQSASVLKLAVIILTSGAYKLYTKVGADSWTFRRAVTNPVFLRCRRNDPNGTQLFLIDGSTLYVSTDWGVTWRTRTLPTSNPGKAMDIYY